MCVWGGDLSPADAETEIGKSMAHKRAKKAPNGADLKVKI